MDILDNYVTSYHPNKMPEPILPCLFKAPKQYIQYVLDTFKDQAGWMG